MALRPCGRANNRLNELLEQGDGHGALAFAQAFGYVGRDADVDMVRALVQPLSVQERDMLNQQFAGVGSLMCRMDATGMDEERLCAFFDAIWPDVSPLQMWADVTGFLLVVRRRINARVSPAA